MFHENVLLFIEFVVIIVETIVIGFLIFHTWQLKNQTQLTREDITALRKATKEMHVLIEELHTGNKLTRTEIKEIHKALRELHRFANDLQEESRLIKKHMEKIDGARV